MEETPQQKGGRARAESLTPDARKAIAAKGSAARWGSITPEERATLPRATHSGEREIGALSLPVYNLSDGRRVFSERGFLALIGAKGRGTTGGHRVSQIIRDPLIRVFFSKEILAAIENPIRFISFTDTLVLGFDAEILSKFCFAFMDARKAHVLRTEVQKRYADYCETLVRAYAEMGLAYWIDEATGYQSERARNELHKILERYLADHWAKWAKTFPDEYYEQVFRLRGWKYDPSSIARPGVLGHMTNDIVYSRLAPGVLTALREKNPILSGRRARKHHQWLTTDYGHPKLKEHISNLIFMMRGASNWGGFHRMLQRSAPRLHETPEFDFDDY